MGRVKTYDRVRKDIWILKAQDNELRKVAKKIGKTQTETIAEAISYWLSAQREMGING